MKQAIIADCWGKKAASLAAGYSGLFILNSPAASVFQQPTVSGDERNLGSCQHGQNKQPRPKTNEHLAQGYRRMAYCGLKNSAIQWPTCSTVLPLVWGHCS